MTSPTLRRGDLEPIVRRELARRSLIDFAQYVDPFWEPAPHLRLIAHHLERLERREIRKLAISMPPRMGKTELTLRKFAPWYMGRHARDQVIIASYGSELAEASGRAVRTLLEDEERYPFAGVKVRQDSRSAGRFETSAGGVLVAVGVGAGLTGRGGDLIACDDLIKDRADAESEAVRASTAGWFSDVLRTRMQPNGVILLIGTMWHESDVLNETLRGPGADDWTKLIIPYFAEDDDLLGRAPGERLWATRFGAADVPSVERGEISSRSFAALYQCRPAPADGNVFKTEWLSHYYDELPRQRPPVPIDPCNPFSALKIDRPPFIVTSLDTASGTSLESDFSVLTTVVSDYRSYFIADVTRARVAFPDLARMVIEVYRKWQPRLIGVEVVAANAGVALFQALQRATALPIIPLRPMGSKVMRADSITNLWESGRVLLPQQAPWLQAFVDEMLAFPAGKHDDQVDSSTYALQMAQQHVCAALAPQAATFLRSNWMSR